MIRISHSNENAQAMKKLPKYSGCVCALTGIDLVMCLAVYFLSLLSKVGSCFAMRIINDYSVAECYR